MGVLGCWGLGFWGCSLARSTLCRCGSINQSPASGTTFPQGVTNLAKTKFGHRVSPSLAKPPLATTNFGQTKIGQHQISVFWVGWGRVQVGGGRGRGPERGMDSKGQCPGESGAPKGGGPKGGGPKKSKSWWSSRGILVVFLKRRGPEMCTFGVLGLSCEAPAGACSRRLRLPLPSDLAQVQM